MDKWLCDNCEDRFTPVAESDWHGCRSNPESCVEGRECPDYRVGCSCPCKEANY